MSDYYLICRSWQFFKPSFPFYNDLNHLHDEKIHSVLDKLCMDHLHQNQDWFKREHRKRNSELRKKIKKRQRSFGERSSGVTKKVYSNSCSKTTPISDYTPYQIARFVGWISSGDQAEFGKLSPSQMLIVLKGKRQFVESVEAPLSEHFSREEYEDYSNLNLKFFSLPVSNFKLPQLIKLENRFDNNIRLYEKKKDGQVLNEALLHGFVVEQSAKTIEVAKRFKVESTQAAQPAPTEQVIKPAEQDATSNTLSFKEKTKHLRTYQKLAVQQYARAYCNMDSEPVDLKEAYDWLLLDEQTDNDDLKKYDTWARYIRKVKTIIGAEDFENFLKSTRTQSAGSVISSQEANYDLRLHEQMID